MTKIHIVTLGCKVNQFESAAFYSGAVAAGCEIVATPAEAHVIILNTCAVTAKAGAQSRQIIRQAAKHNPKARILITGCYAELAAEEIRGFPELAAHPVTIVGNSKKDSLISLAVAHEPSSANHLGNILEATTICSLPVDTFPDRTRAFLRVQDGCENFCSYCIVPYTRGPSRSLPPQQVLDQMHIFAAQGYREVVVTGIHLGNYGPDLPEKSNFFKLMHLLSTEFPKIRFRISSLEPNEITEDLLHLISNSSNIMPHLHIPLQSGDDTILSLMNRRYLTGHFKKIITQCQMILPDAAIGLDLLSGFPGETEQLAQNTEQFLSSLTFSYLHVFPFSSRKGTKAALFPGMVSKHIKEERAKRLREVSKDKQHAFYSKHLGTIRPVLVERKRDANGYLHGYTDNYIQVFFHGSESLSNQIVQVQLSQYRDQKVFGEVLNNED